MGVSQVRVPGADQVRSFGTSEGWELSFPWWVISKCEEVQGIFLTQGLPHLQVDLFTTKPLGKPCE